MRLRLAVLLVLLAVAPSAARAATIAVNTTSSAFNPGDGLCSLPEAVASAGGFHVPDCGDGDNPGVDGIVLPSGTIDTAGGVTLQDVRLLGQGAGTTVLDGGGHDRVLTAFDTVELNGLTVTNGHAPDGGVDGVGLNGGGLLLASGAAVTLTDCAITNNVAGHGGQGANASGTAGHAGGDGGSGGGIYVPGNATLTMSRCTVSGNRGGAGGAGGDGTNSGGAGFGGAGGSGGSGGGVFASFDSQVTIDRSTFTDNHTGDAGPGGRGMGDPSGSGGDGGIAGFGGGFASTGGPVTITSSTFNANRGGAGGDGGEGDGMPLTNSDGTGGDGGGGGEGGGLYIVKGVSDPADAITNTTVAGNSSGDGGNGGKGLHGDGGTPGTSTPGQGGRSGHGGGLALGQVRMTLLHDTIVGNALGTPGVDFGGAGEPPGIGPGIVYALGSSPMGIAKSIVAGCAGNTPGDLGFNLGSAGCPGSGADPQLGPLQDNGGPTQTMRPAAGSPAVDAVPSNMGCAAADQRGVPRPVGIACDIGAVELAAPTVVTGDNSGLTVNGTADGHGLRTIVSFEYGPTTSYGSSLTAGPLNSPGVTPFSVTLPPMEPGTYHYRVVATNTDGTSAGLDRSLTVADTVQPPPASKAPVVTRLTFKPRRLRRGHKATVRFRITEVATVKLSFAKRRGKRYRAAGSLTRRVHAGAVKLTFKRRALKPGRYRLTVVATDVSGRRSKPVRATFRVVAA